MSGRRCVLQCFQQAAWQHLHNIRYMQFAKLAVSAAFIMHGGLPNCITVLLGRSSRVFGDLPSWARQPGLREPLEGLREAPAATMVCCHALSVRLQKRCVSQSFQATFAKGRWTASYIRQITRFAMSAASLMR